MNNLTTIFNQIEEARKAQNISERQLALKVGVDPTNFNKRMKNKKTNLVELVKICEALEIQNLKMY